MLQKVHDAWIKGVLEQSLYSVARLELALTLQPGGSEDVWATLVQRPNRPLCQLPPDPSVTTVFDEVGAALLILGAPGCGKTTLLLELTQTLLERAAEDENHKLPIVFHLSSWAERQGSLNEWLVDELVERYQVPRKHAQMWVEKELILPLLDGLDEVALEARSNCAATINDFQKKHGFVPFVVCSRILDYEALSTKLHIAETLIVQPLTLEQTNNYLIRAGEPLSGIRGALQNDETLWELLDTPLMLSIAALAYQGRQPPEILTSGTSQERKTQLFAAYTNAMFNRRRSVLLYPREITIQWLAWLASAMASHSQSVFYLERIQPNWLPSKWQQRAVNIGAVIICMLSGVLISCGFNVLIFPTAFWGMGVLLGSIFGITGVLMGLGRLAFKKDIQPIEMVRWRWSKARERLWSRLLIGGISGGVLILIPATAWWVIGEIYAQLFFSNEPPGDQVRFFLPFALFGAAIGGLVNVFNGAIEPSDVKTRTIPNEGIRRSFRNAFFLGLFGILFPTACFTLLGLLFTYEIGDIGPLLITSMGGIILGITIAQFVWMRNGGVACCQHFILRLLLWLTSLAPLRYVRFLDYAAERVFLRKVGGGYIFVHRMLLEYFATLYAEKITRLR